MILIYLLFLVQKLTCDKFIKNINILFVVRRIALYKSTEWVIIMTMVAPEFLEWLDDEEPGWVLRKDAPPEIVREFEEYLKKEKEVREK